MHKLISLAIILSLLILGCAKELSVNDNNDLKTSDEKNIVAREQQVDSSYEEKIEAENKIACYSDSDCGVRRAENAYCFQGNPVGDLYIPKCENAGTKDSKCIVEHKSGIIAECGEAYFCYKGECVKYANCKDTDGGLNFSVKGKVLTNDNNVYEDKCEDDRTLIEYYCSSDERAFSNKKICNCAKGACEEEEE